MICLIDNYDSFSYNLYQLIGSINPDIRVVRNDALSVLEIAALKPSHIFLSPGPGRPAEAGVCEDIVRLIGGVIPVFGVCLGHQAICETFGATIAYAKTLMHGKPSQVDLRLDSKLFAGMPPQIQAARYHSLAADAQTIPACLRVIAKTADGEIMAVEHRTKPIYGVQFHPESILTPMGKMIVENFLATAG
ncbi:MAG: aminodeoxychorismate/anthranilate synthase component II [Oscillospiraceae bacterium]|jgi:anthranilate synthase component 2|nr:aminodeoxychorismate/anthranilate synthase component II [Oscillospiraceae bacterium]